MGRMDVCQGCLIGRLRSESVWKVEVGEKSGRGSSEPRRESGEDDTKA